MTTEPVLSSDDYQFGFSQPENYVFKSRKGLDHDIVEQISQMKGEPQWLSDFRHRSLDLFFKRPMPNWGGDLSHMDFQNIFYYIKPSMEAGKTWDEVPADIKETFEKLGIPEAERKYLAGVGTQYECLSGDARVYTARGMVPIRDIVPGDTVFAFDEATNRIIPAKVRATAAKGEREVFEVRVGNRAIRATANHPFLMLDYHKDDDRQRGRYQRAWTYLQDLKAGDLVGVVKDLPETGVDYRLQRPDIKTKVTGHNQVPGVAYELDISNRYNAVTLPESTSDDLMWWLGLYIGDGDIHHFGEQDKASVGIAIPATDAELRDELVRVTERLFGITPTRSDEYHLDIGSTILARFIETNGFGGKALEKRVPTWVHGLPLSQKLAFLGGYLDADGYVRNHPKNHDVSYTSANRDLLEDVAMLLSLCGLPSSDIHRFEGKHPTEPDRVMVGFRLSVSGDYQRITSRSPRRLERMDNRQFHHDHSSAAGTNFSKHVTEFYGFVKIDAITPAGTEMVYDIEVEGPHNFVAEGLIVHNSEMIYHKVRKDLEDLGVIFVDPDTAFREYEDIFRPYFATVIPPNDNKFAALNSAVFSGGSFIYVPKGVRIDLPLQAYFRINAQNMGQFERTLIIADEGAYLHYVEGCFMAGARVQTRQGLKPIETVQTGDEVLTHKGRYQPVTNTTQRPYEGTIYRVRFYGDSSSELAITEEHPLLVSRRKIAHTKNNEFTPEWAPVSLLKPGDYLMIPVPEVDPELAKAHTVTIPLGRGRHEPAQKDVTLPVEPDFFRLVGYYLAEGHVDNEHYITFTFHVEETVFIEDTKALLERYFGKAPSENKPRLNGQTLVLSSTEAARTFARVFGATVERKTVPEFMRHAPAPCLIELVRGMWLGDGSYDERKNMFRFNSVSSDLTYAFRDALLRLGIAASVNRQERESPRQPMYVVVVSSPFNAAFGKLVGVEAPNGSQSGSPFHLDEHYLYAPIKAIEIDERETTVYNLSVAEDESYVAEGVVSHNCTAPTYTTDSLHSAVVEIIVRDSARVRYTTIQNWSKNVYNLVTKRAQAFRNATMEWVDGNLGCLAEGSTVTTPEGVKAIEAVEVGDQVLSYDEQAQALTFRAVTAKRFSGAQPVHTVAVGERALRVTANHPFYAPLTAPDAPHGARLGYVRADHLTEAIIPLTSLAYGAPHRLRTPNAPADHAAGQYGSDLAAPRAATSLTTNDSLMWLFGYWLGDGAIEVAATPAGDAPRATTHRVAAPPRDHAQGRLAETMTALVATAPAESDANHLPWGNKELAEFFTLNGFYGHARSKRAPKWVWSLPESQRLAFIAGYVDAAGATRDGLFSLKSTNHDVLADLASLLVTLGITPRIYTEFAGAKTVAIMDSAATTRGAYRLAFPADARLVPHVSPVLREQVAHDATTVRAHRNLSHSRADLPGTLSVAEVQVSPASADLVPTWDIEVAGTGNFVAQGFIVHNSKLTMKYPAVWLMEPGAKGEVLSVAFASDGQHQDAGGKMVHVAPDTSSSIVSKSISKGTGRSSYRGLLKVNKGAPRVKSNVRCDALLINESSRTDTYPYIEIEEEDVEIGHEASVSKVGEEQLFYLMSRGLSESDAYTMIVNGFIEPIAKELPLEYAVELNRLIQLEMSGSVG